jgi:hypothetical protein
MVASSVVDFSNKTDLSGQLAQLRNRARAVLVIS